MTSTYITPEGEPFQETWRDFDYKPCVTPKVKARFNDLLLLPKRLKLARMKDIPFDVSRHTETVRRAKFQDPPPKKEEDKREEETEQKNKQGQEKASAVVPAIPANWPCAVSSKPTYGQQSPIRGVQPSVPRELVWLYAALCAICFMMALLPPFRKLIFREVLVKVGIDEVLAPVLGAICSIGDSFPIVRNICSCLYNIFGFWVLAGGAFWAAKWVWENRDTFVLPSVRIGSRYSRSK